MIQNSMENSEIRDLSYLNNCTFETSLLDLINENKIK